MFEEMVGNLAEHKRWGRDYMELGDGYLMGRIVGVSDSRVGSKASPGP